MNRTAPSRSPSRAPLAAPASAKTLSGGASRHDARAAGADPEAGASGTRPVDLTFERLLAATALARGEAPALCDATGARLTYRQLDDQVGRLANLLVMVRDGDGPGADRPVSLGILAPMGPQATITLLAALRAGLRPFLIPPDMAAMALAALLDAHGAEFAIGVDRVGDLEPLHALREAAARVFGLRFVGGFGRAVPDGIVPLDRVLADVFPDAAPVSVQGRIGLPDRNDPYLPMQDIDEATLLAGGMQIADTIDAAPDSQIVSTLVGGGFESLATGLATALVGGTAFMPLGLFDLAALEQALGHQGGSHLVIPASVEAALHDSGLLEGGAILSLIVVGAEATAPTRAHTRPPARPPARALPIIDVSARGGAIVATRR